LVEKAGIQEKEHYSGLNHRLYHRNFNHRVHPHLLRHTALTLIQESCGDAFVTKEIAGHSSLAMTDIYVHLSQGRKREGVDLAFKNLSKVSSTNPSLEEILPTLIPLSHAPSTSPAGVENPESYLLRVLDAGFRAG